MKRLIMLLACLAVVILAGPYITGAQQVGTAISSNSYNITESGFYYVTGNLAPGAGALYSIKIQASDVTIDLMGYSLIGPGSDGPLAKGISISPNYSNIEVRNGTIRNFHSSGVYAYESCSNIRIINIRVLENGNGVLLGGYGSLVKDCTASNNTQYGIRCTYGSTITGNIVYSNRKNGIHAVDGCTITDNIAFRNEGRGISVNNGCTLTGNTVYKNDREGIYSHVGCMVTGNTAYENRRSGIKSAGAGCTISDNTAVKNGNYGIELSTLNLVDGNTAIGNNDSGGNYTNIEACPGCTFGLNVAQ